MTLFLGLITNVLILVNAVLARFEAIVVARNKTITGLSLTDDLLTFNLDRDIVDPVCGLTYVANINVKNRGDPSKTSDYCNLVYRYITNTASDGKTSKNVNVVYTCPGTPEPTDVDGYGSLDIKLILNAPSDFPRDQTQEPATLHLLNIHDAADLTMPVTIGYKVTSNSELIWQYINCP
ncbi:uncharacterized protein Z519_03374 [Cladophialophora bantiana CBS 173.52]|uniref:Uncharacterized protein n=1 Tax=Cladophialophora bantiana (strain ATCC 10958 / CBS 173.52 / CDC B-1940 / NIH 8579) TaxID=1442370 RepID=A0A0D2HZF7_CLAB1|nr:uncharacterized protein Z519_03374 [Cladophialophora bantiana CBS 173.52]KIW96305.1 hypothetical protein Z519_03374 [Cladophialophora bantiana CBS 173.52]